MSYRCNPCDKIFQTPVALLQHRNSPAHKHECQECDRVFGSERALQQHLDSSVHASIYADDPLAIYADDEPLGSGFASDITSSSSADQFHESFETEPPGSPSLVEGLLTRTEELEKQLSRAEQEVATLKKEHQCNICCDKRVDTVIQCGHLFCAGCIANWQRSHSYGQANAPCPTCKVPIRHLTKMYI